MSSFSQKRIHQCFSVFFPPFLFNLKWTSQKGEAFRGSFNSGGDFPKLLFHVKIVS